MKDFKWKDTIYTDGSKTFLKYEKNKLKVTLRVYKDNNIENIFLRISPDGEQELLKMKKTGGDSFFDYYISSFDIKKNINNYRFFIITSDEILWYSQKGLTRTNPPDGTDFKFIRDFERPEWVENSVFYQIFPDRFHDGNPSTNVKDGEYTYEGKATKSYPWGERPKSYQKGGHLDFFGGDLAGIKEKIPYIKELGINAVYLNPIFLSPSNHKYDTQDYKMIDPHMGTNEEFAELGELLHKEGIRIILDGVFNHCGISHYWFNKSGFYPDNEGAWKNKDSPWREYFTFYDNGDYHAWKGVKTLPKLNYKSEKLRQEIYKSHDSIMNFWLSPPYNADGWRLDVANMVARQDDYQNFEEVYREMRKSVKGCKKDAFLMGEHFFDATPLIQGDMLDSVMNYQGFLFPILRWITKKERMGKDFKPIKFTSEDLMNNLSDFYSLIPFDVRLSMFNLLGCHDLPRFYSLCGENLSLFKMGLSFLFTYPGVPCIYNGDETGMTAIEEHEVRKCFDWNEKHWNKDIMELYKNFIKLRKNSSPLKKGGFKILYAGDDVFSYARFFEGQSLLFIANNNPCEKMIELPLWNMGDVSGTYEEYFSGNIHNIEKGYMSLNIKPHESLILIKK